MRGLNYIRNKCKEKKKKKTNKTKTRKKGLEENKLNKKFGEINEIILSVYSRLKNEGENLIKPKGLNQSKNGVSFLIKKDGGVKVKIISLELCKGSKDIPPYIIYTEGVNREEPKVEFMSLQNFSEEEFYRRVKAFFL